MNCCLFCIVLWICSLDIFRSFPIWIHGSREYFLCSNLNSSFLQSVIFESGNLGYIFQMLDFSKRWCICSFSYFAQIFIINYICPVQTIRFWNYEYFFAFFFTFTYSRGHFYVYIPWWPFFWESRSRWFPAFSIHCKLPRLTAVQQSTSDTCF